MIFSRPRRHFPVIEEALHEYTLQRRRGFYGKLA